MHAWVATLKRGYGLGTELSTGDSNASFPRYRRLFFGHCSLAVVFSG